MLPDADCECANVFCYECTWCVLGNPCCEVDGPALCSGPDIVDQASAVVVPAEQHGAAQALARQPRGPNGSIGS
jgi:hypothetical protein